jgi:hypothetical protein
VTDILKCECRRTGFGEYRQDMDTLVFKNGGIFAPMAPTIHCKTCKDRRHEGTGVNDEEQEKGFVFLSKLFLLECLQRNVDSSNLLTLYGTNCVLRTYKDRLLESV